MEKSNSFSTSYNSNFFIYSIFFFSCFVVLNLCVYSAPPIPISSLTDLTKIGNDPAYPLNGAYYLTNDIDAYETRSWPGGFDPIGDNTVFGRFKGDFKGNGYAIYNLYINRPAEEYVGLFSFVEGPTASISNLRLHNVEISGKNIVGGLAGIVAYGSVKGCVVSGVVQASGNCGGIAGVLGSIPLGGSVVIDRCCTFGYIKWEDYNPLFRFNFGGLCGLISGITGTVEVVNSFSQMNIFTSETDMQYVGGLAGRLEGIVNVQNCYSTGEVPNGLLGIGGLIGYADDPNLVKNSVWDMETSRQTNSAGGKGYYTSEMKTTGTYSDMGWDISEDPCADCPTIWSIYKDQTYPFLCNLSNRVPNVKGETLSDAMQLVRKRGFDYELVGVQHNTIPPDTAVGTVPEENCFFPQGDKVVIIYVVGPFPPIYISTVEELQLIGNHPDYPDDNLYILANDIDASDTRHWNGGAGFIPISSFKGVFEGNGYKISRLYISDDTGLSTGLFREIKKVRGDLGRVRNLIIDDAEVHGIKNVGVLAGEIYSLVPEFLGTIDYLAVSGEVSGVSTVGGLAGIIRGGLTVFDCSIRVNVHQREVTIPIAYEKFGGVFGQIEGCTLWRVSFIGDIHSDLGLGRMFGGIAGYTSEDAMMGAIPRLLNCYAHARINTGDFNDYVGGLVGFANINTEVSNSYSASKFTTITSTTGGLIGSGNSPVVVNSSYWDKDISGVSDSFGGGTPETTENMKKSSTFVGWDFVWYWGINENESYPILLYDRMEMASFLNKHYETAKEWALFYGVNYSFDYQCSNTVPVDFIISQSVPAGEWVPVFSSPVTLTVSTGMCPPISISTIEEIALIGRDPAYPADGNYVLTSDIDASDTVNWNGGAGFDPIPNFLGMFDGGGYIISDLYINRPSASLVGLFGDVGSTGRLLNVYIKNANIKGYWAVGILAGRNLGVIHHCGVHGVVEGDSGSSSIGSMVGANEGGIYNCLGVAQVVGDSGIGGLIGTNTASPFTVIHDNYFWGTVFANDIAGGFVGYNMGNIENAYAVAKINPSKSASIGGFCGLNDGGTISSSYWDKEYSGIEISDGGEGKTTAEMMTQSTFSGWDFVSVWTINEGVTYPFLISNRHLLLGDFRGQFYEPVRDALESVGMFTSSTERCDWVYDVGQIIDHSYIGLDIPIFTNIDFVVSIGLCTTVPNVVGLPQGEAENEILNAKLVVGNVTYECNNLYPSGVVFEQNPVGGEVVVEGTPVDIKVSTCLLYTS
ncbi:MAG: PASTA domain-containing protein, partial [Candidatus Hydrogenedentes bacterium]|nr:PASTA domain-containing protein [Candidatus Hydrogenedentota bacterium]